LILVFSAFVEYRRIGEYDWLAHPPRPEFAGNSHVEGAHGQAPRTAGPKQMQRYVTGFAGRHDAGDADTIDRMNDAVAGAVGKLSGWR